MTIQLTSNSILKELFKDNQQIYKKGGIKPKATKINKMAILRETFIFKLPEVNHFSKERKGNQPRLRK